MARSSFLQGLCRPLAILALAVAALFAAKSVYASSATAVVGQSATISVTNDGTAPFTYQWRKNAANITSATNSTYVLANVQLADAGNYSVVVTNSAGSTTSDDAVLSVINAPSYDNFSNAILISGSSASLTGSNVGASKEAGEPNHAGNAGGHSVWWKWVAPASGAAFINTTGSGFDTLLGVYTGSSVSALTTIASDDDSGGSGTSSLTFTAISGTTYWIAVDGKGGASGAITLNLATSPANDNFANAILISGSSAALTGSNVYATKESGEPNHAGNAGGHSLWWKWTAPINGQATFNTVGSNFDTLLGIYTGSSVSALTAVASDDDSGGAGTSLLTTPVISGTTYYIAVDGKAGVTGSISLNLNVAAAPANDNLASATVINGSSATVSGTNLNATKQSGEPNHAGNPGGHSVWWQWTAPASGQATINTAGSNFDTLLGVYTGTSVSALTTIASNDDSGGTTSAVAFDAVAGTTYRIAVDGKGGAIGSITLTVNLTAPPGNDNFASATGISGSTAQVTGTDVGATKESGEPNHAGNVGGHSVWWRWTSPGTGPVSLNTVGSSFDTLLGVYTGSSVGALTTVGSDDDSGGSGTSALTFNATFGATYMIAVDGKGGVTGSVTLSLIGQFGGGPTAPANDNFASATVTSGSSVTATGSNANATKETGEPNHAGNAGGHSAWWRWTAPASGVTTLNTIGSSFDTLLGIYTGSSVSALTTVSSDDDSGGSGTSSLSFTAVFGTTYWIAVDGKSGATGSITLTLNLTQPPPANDNFANAILISGSSAGLSGSNLYATKEAGEPNHAGNAGGHSVWWRWTAPANGILTLSTVGSSFDTLLGVYTGSSVSALTTVSSDDDSGGSGTSSLTSAVTSGTTYWIAVDGKGGATGSITLDLNLAPPPPGNDDFANAILISGSSAGLSGSNLYATKEAGEPNHAGNSGGHSIWWKWTAPFDGPATFSTVGSSFNTLLGVYTGSSVGALTTVASDDDSGGSGTSSLSFTAVSGTTYWIAVDGKSGATGSVTLNLNLIPPAPGNDNFADAILISGSSAALTGSNLYATKEAGEPNHAGNAGGHSVWWKWTAPGNGILTLSTIGSNFDTLLGVYTGSTVGALTTVSSDDNSGGSGTSSLTFTAVSGTAYWIAVDGKGGATGSVTLTLDLAPPPPTNDNFANAILISGSSAAVTGSNLGATKETGEPIHAGNAGGHSVWWKWTAPFSGQAAFNTVGSNFDTLLGVYTGASVAALTTVASDDDNGGSGTSSLTFTAVSGTTYWIAVDGKGGATGSVTLNLNLIPPAPTNDNFANAILMTGSSAAVTGSNLYATKEAGEPNHAGNAGGHSVWWTWTAPASQQATFGTIGSSFDTLLGVYTGSSVGVLTTVSSDDDSGGSGTSSLTFAATSGTTYMIAVDGKGGATGSITLTLNLAPPPPANDNFTNAILMSGSSAALTGSNAYATKEAGEPSHAGNAGGHSVWWRWTASFSGQATFNTVGSNFDTLLGVYTGSSVGTLTTVVSDDDSGGSGTSSLTFAATSGTTYWLAVDGKGGATGSITLTLDLRPPPPGNDNFLNASLVSGSSAAPTGSNLGATKEAGEPNHAGNAGGHSVWWRWIAPADGMLALSTVGSNFDTLVAVYNGSSVSALTAVASDDDSGGSGTSSLSFTATSGTTYWIAVDGKGGATGSVTLNLNLLPPAPGNDNFASAILISGSSAALTGGNANATKETGEPNHAGNAGGHSVWWKWTAPFSGLAYLNGSGFDTLLGVYTGSSVSALTTVASDDDSGGSGTSSLTFAATTGTTYYFAVDGKAGATGSINLSLGVATAPANDNLASATVINGSSATVSGTNLYATKEAGEPNHAGNAGGHSVWWKWVPSITGYTALNTLGSNFDTLLGVYTGSSVGALTAVASDDDSGGSGASSLTFTAVSGTTYWIAVDGKGGATASIRLTVNLTPPPTSDDFASATTISGSSAQVTGVNVSATKEAGEPNHAGNPGGHSIWWRWVAPSAGPVSLNTSGSGIDTLLGVYTGSGVSALTTIASDDDTAGNGASSLTFNATAGTTYWIAVDGKGGATGSVALNLIGQFSPPAGSGGGGSSGGGSATTAFFQYLAGLARDGAGNLYAVDSATHTIMQITPAGVMSTFAGSTGVAGYLDGTGTSAQFNQPGGVAADISGTIYVADTGNSVIRKITSAGVVTTLAGSAGSRSNRDGTGTAAAFNNPTAVAVDTYGNIYVADAFNNTIRKVTSSGVVTTLAGSASSRGDTDGTGSHAQFDHPAGIAVDGSGTYAYVADAFNNTIRRITLSTGDVATLAGSPGIIGDNNGTAYQALFNFPIGLAIDGSSNVYVADAANALVRRVTPGGVVTTLAGMAGVAGFKDATGTSAMFDQPSGLALDAAGNVYVADTGNSRLRTITAGGSVTTMALTAGSISSATGASGTLPPSGTAATTVPSLYLASVATDSSGNLYVAESANNIILKVTPGGTTTTLAGLVGVAGMKDGTGTAALFNRPIGVAVDGTGNVYVADTANNAIRKVTSSGVVTTLAGSAAAFNNPTGVAVDGGGNVYVADTFNNTIRKVTSAGVVTTLAGLAGSRNETDGTGTAAAFNNPTGVAVDASGNVYVVDTFNNTIRKITSAGVVTTVAGSAGLIGMNNGTGANALFNLPIGVAVDAANNIYVADAGNALIRKIAPGGTVTIVAGVAGVAGLSNTAGASALFNQPRGLARDAAGNIYVADTGNALIRKIGTDADATVTSVALTVQLPAGPGSGSIATGGGGGTGGMVDTSFTGGGSGGSSGGPTSSGGGAMESWFVAALILLAFARRRTRR